MTLIMVVATIVALLVGLVALSLARAADTPDMDQDEREAMARALRYRNVEDRDLSLVRALGRAEGRR